MGNPGRWIWSERGVSWFCVIVTFVVLAVTKDGPGLTVDEPLDVRPGRTYWETLVREKTGFFQPKVVDRVFRDNAEHPPLGRWLLGLASWVGQPGEILTRGVDPVGLYVRAGRWAPILAFVLLMGVTTRAMSLRCGPMGGLATGIALLAMPRLFAHAHFAALDSILCAFWVWSLIKADSALRQGEPTIAVMGAGVIWGLALLTKIHAWLLVPLVALRFLLQGPLHRAVTRMVVWGCTGLAVFGLGWPWLWFDGVNRLLRFLATSTQRQSIYVTYFGRVYADVDLPWHYPWVYFAITVPVILHVMGVWGIVTAVRFRRADPFPLVLLAGILMFLTLFATRIPVYDGERLFLVVFPLWAMLIGLGSAALWDHIADKTWLKVVFAVTLVSQLSGTVLTYPYNLSYYNTLVGGSVGAEKLGLELTYWTDALDDHFWNELLEHAQKDDAVALAPTMAPEQGKILTTRELLKAGIVIGDDNAVAVGRWVVVHRREAYWSPSIRALVRERRPVYTQGLQGVWLVGIWPMR